MCNYIYLVTCDIKHKTKEQFYFIFVRNKCNYQPEAAYIYAQTYIHTYKLVVEWNGATAGQ